MHNFISSTGLDQINNKIISINTFENILENSKIRNKESDFLFRKIEFYKYSLKISSIFFPFSISKQFIYHL